MYENIESKLWKNCFFTGLFCSCLSAKEKA